jgi:CheY-like chemotaxis protein
VVLAADAQQAKIIVKKQTFDLIMMDVWMPGLANYHTPSFLYPNSMMTIAP